MSLDYQVTRTRYLLIYASTYAIEERTSSSLIPRNSLYSNICRIIRDVYPLHACGVKLRPLRGGLQFVGIRILGADEGGPVRLDCRYERVAWWARGAPDGGEFGDVGDA